MKILVVVHQFLPRNGAGTEVYTYKIAKALQARGHQLWIYYAARDSDRADYELTRGSFDGLPIFEVARNRPFDDFRHVYKDERMEARLGEILDEVRPDLVHIQHLHHHSIDYLGILAGRGIPIAYTLAEYLNICLRSWLIKRDFTLCDGPQVAECARCASGWSPFPKSASKSALGALTTLETKSAGRRYSLARFLRKLRHRLWPSAYASAVELRLREHREQLGQVDLFVAPSRFLRERFIASGMVRPEQILYSDYGTDLEPFEGLEAPGAEPGAQRPLRVGFIGAIAEQKGVHLLVQACSELDDDRVECRIYGSLEAFPDYAAKVREVADARRVTFIDQFQNNRVGSVLRELDVLVVPSRWYENSPLTIHEAFAAGLPVITGHQGGMAELVEHETNGLHFRIGDSEDLRRQIARLLEEPELLGHLRAGIPRLKTIAEDAEETEERFRELVQARRSASSLPTSPSLDPDRGGL